MDSGHDASAIFHSFGNTERKLHIFTSYFIARSARSDYLPQLKNVCSGEVGNRVEAAEIDGCLDALLNTDAVSQS
jgi:hypothetical protein